MVVTPINLDPGISIDNGTRWHYSVEIDGRRWNRGDEFWVLDRRGAPRRLTFQYVVSPDGSICKSGEADGTTTVCYSYSFFRTKDGGRVPFGFVSMAPVAQALDIDRQLARLLVMASDAEEAGLTLDRLQQAIECFESSLPNDDLEDLDALQVWVDAQIEAQP